MPTWIKATSRLPGLSKAVKWRSSLLDIPEEDQWLEVILEEFAHVKSNLEWLDESESLIPPPSVQEEIDGVIEQLTEYLEKLQATSSVDYETVYEVMLQDVIALLKRQKLNPPSVSIGLVEQAKAWAKWYANEGSYQDWLKLSSSPFGTEGDFAKTLRIAEAAFIAGHNSQPSVQVLLDALSAMSSFDPNVPGKIFKKRATEALQQFNTGEEKQEANKKIQQ